MEEKQTKCNFIALQQYGEEEEEEARFSSESKDWRRGLVEGTGASFERQHWDSKSRARIPPPKRSAGDKRPCTDRYGCLVRCKKTGRWLLVRQKSNGFWGAPKGSHEMGETAWECAQREMLEETGAFVEVEELKLGETLTVQSDERYGRKKYTVVLILCEEEFEPHVDGVEIDEGKWMSDAEITECDKASFTSRMFEVLRTHTELVTRMVEMSVRVPNLEGRAVPERYMYFAKQLSLEERKSFTYVSSSMTAEQLP